MNYHVIIKVERRAAPRELALPVGGQLHTMGERIDDISNIAYAASWDGKAPYVEVIAGDIATIRMAYMGWPMVTKDQWEAQNKGGETQPDASGTPQQPAGEQI